MAATVELEPMTAEMAAPKAAPVAKVRPAWQVSLLTGFALFFVAAVVVLIDVSSHPAFTHNWENYVAWDGIPFFENPDWSQVWKLSDGVMLNSGKSPLFLGPAWLMVKWQGISLESFRTSNALVGALAVPMLWFVGRRLVSERVARIAAVLLLLSTVYLTYARTATLVSVSIVPFLLTVYVLVRIAERPRWYWPFVLTACLVVNSYGYSVLRFAWPLAMALLVIEFVRQKGKRVGILAAIVIPMVVMPFFVSKAVDDPLPTTKERVEYYFQGHNEQVTRMQLSAFNNYIRVENQDQMKADDSRLRLGYILVKQNLGDLTRLFFDVGTMPTTTDYWNARGRWQPWFLVAFVIVGIAITARGIWRRPEDRIMLGMALGFSIPLAATSVLHVGRLILVTPLLVLFAARAIDATVTWGEQNGRRLGRPDIGIYAGRVFLALALLVVAQSTFADLRLNEGTTVEARIAASLRRDLPMLEQADGPVALVTDPGQGAEIEAVNTSGLYLQVYQDFRFINLHANPVEAFQAHDRIPVYYGFILNRLDTPDLLPNFCRTTFYVVPQFEAEFRTKLDAALPLARCAGRSPQVMVVEG